MRIFSSIILALSLGLPLVVLGQSFPNKLVRVVIPFSPGGGAEAVNRLVTTKLSELWEQPVIIEYKPGAGTTVAGAYVAKAAPDGYTILSASSSLLLGSLLRKELPYDTVKSFATVCWMTEVPSLLVVPESSPARSVRELVELARKHSATRQLNYGSSGIGGSQHLNAEIFLSEAKAKAVHIPHKGTAQVTSALLGQQLDFAFADQSSRALARAGKIRVLAVTTSKRWKALPDVPTLLESIGHPGIATRHIYLVPAATPASITNQINATVVRALRSPDLEEKMTTTGYNIVASTPAEAARYWMEEYRLYEKLIKEIGLTAN